MTDIPHEKPVSAPARNWFAVQIALALALTALADWLFFEGYFGINVSLYALCLCLATVLGIGIRQPGALVPAVVVIALAVAPAAESVSMLSLLFVAAGVVFFTLSVTREHTSEAREWLRRTTRLIVGGPIHICGDLRRYCIATAGNGSLGALAKRLSIWIAPILLGSLFIWIFATANPIIDDTLRSLAFDPTVEGIDVQRIMLWMLVLSFVWPFVRLRKGKQRENSSADSNSASSSSVKGGVRLIQIESILVSLVLFNLIFAAQNVLDFTYLWGNAALPPGMTYAEYAHRGVYPLIWAALLSAAFVLIALRPGTSADRVPSVRILVFLWLGQNIILVFSSAQRLNLYVDAYALTESRMTAFVWMWLVALGLVLIVVRIAQQRTNRWLVSTNAAAGIITIYGSCFVNLESVITNYNVRKSFELSGIERGLDVSYLRLLGPQAIPAFDELIKFKKGNGETTAYLELARTQLANEHVSNSENWRAWGLRAHRLSRYLATHESRQKLRERMNPHRF